jgi:hypothetical protein
MIFCYEDYYYDDITLLMIEELQPHIDIEEFSELWNDLDEIRTLELFSDIILNMPNFNVSSYKYNLIDNYVNKYRKHNYPYTNELLKDFNELLKINKFSKKYINFNKQIDEIITIEEATNIAKQILEFIPSNYSSILPL